MNDETRPKDFNKSRKAVALAKNKVAIEAKQSNLPKHLQAIRASSSGNSN